MKTLGYIGTKCGQTIFSIKFMFFFYILVYFIRILSILQNLKHIHKYPFNVSMFEGSCLFEGRQCEFHYTLKTFIKQIRNIVRRISSYTI